MFGRGSSPDSKPQEGAPDRAATGPRATPVSTQYASIIGPDLAVVGEKITLICKSSLLIAGEVLGDVNGDDVTVGETGKVTGTITAHNLAVHGQVDGSLRATSATLHATARVNGDILQQNLVIAEGAQFDGRVRIASAASEVEPQLDPTAVAGPQSSF